MARSPHCSAVVFGISAIALVFSGCRCGGETTGSESSLRLVVPNAKAEDFVDFGEVRAGSGGLRELRLENAGRGGLTLVAAAARNSQSVAVEGATSPDRIFSVDAVEGIDLRGGESRTVTIRVQATATDKVAVRTDFEAHVIFRSTSGDEVEATLRTTVVPDDCAVPDELDFGNVWSGTEADKALEFPSASTAEPTTVQLGEVRNLFGPDFVGLYELNSFDAPAGGLVSIPFRVKAAGSQQLRAFVDVKRSDRCKAEEVVLKATAITAGLSVSPSPVDCGFVPVGHSKLVQATVKNIAPDAVTLTGFTASGAFAFEPKLEILTLGGGAAATLNILCAPSAEGLEERTLTFSTSQPRQPKVSFQARVYGGGPDIDVEPRTLTFGSVPWVRNASLPVVQQRSVTVRNVGSVVPDKSGHLYLGNESGSGLASAFQIVPLNAATTEEEFTVVVRTQYDPSKGLLPIAAGGGTLRVDIRLAPASAGQKAAELIIRSNDFDEPELRVRISADAFEAPHCEYAVEPRALEFGIAAYPGTVRRSARFTNLADGGANDCYVSVLGIDPIEAEFQAGNVTAQRVQPGGEFDLPVTFAPKARPDGGMHSLTANLALSVSSMTSPNVKIDLSATAGPPCLTVIPPEHDFGEVRVGCGSAPKTLQLYNGCAVPLSLSTVSTSGASFSGSGFDGGTYLPPFAGPTSVDVSFAPLATGNTEGAVAISYQQSDAGTKFVVPLSGEGVASTTREDVFQQSAAPKVDIAITYQDFDFGPYGGSINFSDNIQHLATFLMQGAVDFHVGITWPAGELPRGTDPIPMYPGVRGAFLLEGSPSEPWLSGFTADFENKFKARFFRPQADPLQPNDSPTNVRWWVAHESSCFETMTKALTPPRSTNENAGFRRADAGFLGICAIWGDDCSPGGSPGTTESFFTAYAKLMTAAGNRSDTIVSSAAKLDSSDGYTCVPAGAPLRTVLMAQLTGGQNVLYHDNLWAAELQDSIYAAAGLPREFKLGAVPMPASLEVLINSALVSATDSTGATVWSYDPARNAVVFDEAHRPGAGASVRLRYTPVCY